MAKRDDKTILAEMFKDIQTSPGAPGSSLETITSPDVITPEAFVLTCAQQAHLDINGLCQHFQKPRSWYYQMMGLTETQERLQLLRDSQVSMNPSIGASLEERFRSNIIQCTDILAEKMDQGSLTADTIIDIAALGVKALGIGQKVTAAERLAQVLDSSNDGEENIADKLVRALREQKKNASPTTLSGTEIAYTEVLEDGRTDQ